MSLRQATVADIPEMQRVRSSVRENTLRDYSVLTPELYREHLEQRGRGWVYEHRGRIVGLAIANRDSSSIWALFVEHGFERQGIGRALHDEMIRWLGSEGLRQVTLGTSPGTRAAGFYEAAGWKLRDLDTTGQAIYELRLG